MVISLISPVRGGPQLGHSMHRCRPNLYLKGLALSIEHYCMQRLVTIAFGTADVIIELVGKWFESSVDKIQNVVADRNIIHNDSHTADVVDFIDYHTAPLHLSIDAGDALDPAVDLSPDTLLRERRFQPGGHPSKGILLLSSTPHHTPYAEVLYGVNEKERFSLKQISSWLEFRPSTAPASSSTHRNQSLSVFAVG